MKLMDFIKEKKFLVLMALFIITPILISLLIAKFNLLKKKQLPLPPSGQTRISLPKSNPKPAFLQQGPYTCPSTKDFCQKGQDILKDGKYIGFGATMASGSALLASFDGKISTVIITLHPPLNSEKIAIIYLDNQDRGLRAIYYFKGDVPNIQNVKAGQKLASTQAKINFYNASLVFALIKNYPQTNEAFKLSTKDFALP